MLTHPILTMHALDDYARRYYLAGDIADHGIEHRIQIDSAPRILDRLPPGRVLELGYGDGILTQGLQTRGIQAELLEGSKLLAEKARAAHPALTVHHALFETFTPPAPYDAVLALHVLEHLDDPVTILRRIGTWLTPGGQAILVVPNRDSLHRRLALRMGLIARLDELSPRDHLVGHPHVYDLAALEADVRAAGLHPETRFGSFLKLLPNSMMLDYPPALLTAIESLSDDLPPEMLANIGLVAVRPDTR